MARLCYGEENVPAVVNPRGLPHSLCEVRTGGQVVVTDLDIHSGSLRGEISAFRAGNEAHGSGRARVESGVTQRSIRGGCCPSRRSTARRGWTSSP